MPEEPVETEYHEEGPQDYNLPSEPSTARPVAPVTFFGPSADPSGEKDFRPTAITLSEEQLDQVREDGHGNFQHPSEVPPKHPSEPRQNQPYENKSQTNVADDEGSEEPSEE